ncbi:hypothetical protein FRC17_005155 [Serendipita sp. 399]|nr:hypothetical protein FRC17_005155 [Serendipita sp. 399]
MYCNEAYTVDNESVEDWTSSLQMLLTFAAIFSAVLITLIVDSKMLLQQDNTEVLVDAVIFLMNNLANGTHRPYDPPKFRPSTQSILVNCFFFASLCLSIATALAAVLAMQWVTDYGAVTRRAGSTPEERVKRRHFRYQGGQDWRIDTIIGALPVALHLSVLLFFVGLIVWMWDVHHSVFAVVFVCGAVAALFYVLTTILVIFYPSCPYRTPLAGWIYTLLHLLITIISRLAWFSGQKSEPSRETAKREDGEEAEEENASWLQRLMSKFRSHFAQASLNLRDDIYIQSSDNGLMGNSLIWLSNHISISPEVYRRLLVLINGFTPVIGGSAAPSIRSNVPWNNIFHALGAVYMSFVQNRDLGEDEFTEFARQTHCLRNSGLAGIFKSAIRDGEPDSDSSDFPLRLLYAWIQSTSSHDTEALRRLRFSDEISVNRMIRSILRTPKMVIETWYSLLSDESTTCERILPELLRHMHLWLHFDEKEQEQMISATLYIISTGSLPWASQVAFKYAWGTTPVLSNPLVRRLRVTSWVQSLSNHSQKELILKGLSDYKEGDKTAVLLPQNRWTEDDTAELKRTGLGIEVIRWTQPEELLYSVLKIFDDTLTSSKQDMETWMLTILCEDLLDSSILLSAEYFGDRSRRSKMEGLRRLSNPRLRLIACVTLGVQWETEWLLEVDKALPILPEWTRISKVCFKDPPPVTGDLTALWRLRLQLWTYFDYNVTTNYLYSIIDNLDTLKRVQQEIRYTKLGVNHSDDLLLALFHLNYPYGREDNKLSLVSYVPDILTGNTGSMDDAAPYGCIEYLTSVCEELSADPARLIRLLIELIRADINRLPQYRRPKILLGLLMHARTHLSSKKLRPFSPSCRRLTGYIKESLKQFKDNWDVDIDDSQSHYKGVNKAELEATCEEVLALLNPTEPWDGEEKDISWPEHLLKSTEITEAPSRDNVDLEAHSTSRDASGGGKGGAERIVHDEQSARNEDAPVDIKRDTDEEE